MIAKLLLAACLVGTALGHGHRHDCCTPGDQKIVQEQWSRLWRSADSGNIKLTLGRLVFERLFERAPETRALFKRVNGDVIDSPEFQAHAVRVLNGMDIVINLLQDTDAAKAALAHLADQHAVRDGVTASQFEVLGGILLEGLGKLVPDLAYGSWKGCFGRIANGITAGLPA